MMDKSKLGKRFVCFQCGCKFYDMNREVPTCPDCSADQREAPVRDIRAILASRALGRTAPTDEEDRAEGEEEDIDVLDEEEGEDEDEDDDDELLGSYDEDEDE